MADNIVALDGKPLEPETKHDVALVELLERCIRDIKTGRANSVAVVLAGYDEANILQIDTSWHGKRLMLLAGASRLTHRLNLDQDDDNVEL